MNKEKITVSLQILLLNDLLRVKAIDKDIYDKAVQKVDSLIATQSTNLPLAATPA